MSPMCLISFLTISSVLLSQCDRTKTYGTSETWFVKENGHPDIFQRDRPRHKETTECTCTCEVQDNQTNKTPQDEPRHDWKEEDGRPEGRTSEWSTFNHPATEDVHSKQTDVENEDGGRKEESTFDKDNENHEDNAIDPADAPDRYKGYSYGHGSRFPWKGLKDAMCIRQPCGQDSDCCLRWNICDKSAKVCTNCWYGHPCVSERDCCHDFPHCQRKWKKDANGRPTSVESGRCSDQR